MSESGDISDDAYDELYAVLDLWQAKHNVGWMDLSGALTAKLIRIECDETGLDGPEVMKRISERLLQRRAFEMGAN